MLASLHIGVYGFFTRAGIRPVRNEWRLGFRRAGEFRIGLRVLHVEIIEDVDLAGMPQYQAGLDEELDRLGEQKEEQGAR